MDIDHASLGSRISETAATKRFHVAVSAWSIRRPLAVSE
jgi:hypothetical protein